MSELPWWSDLKRPIADSKPPIRARAIESSPDQNREAWVLHDGQNGWYITEGLKTELTSVDSTTIVDSDRFETIRGIRDRGGIEQLGQELDPGSPHRLSR